MRLPSFMVRDAWANRLTRVAKAATPWWLVGLWLCRAGAGIGDRLDSCGREREVCFDG
jgi:hypothetical protein